MRSLLLAISFLFLASAVASQWPMPVTAQPPESLRWVRTVDGWEPSVHLLPRPEREPGLHPFTLALLQLLVAGFALVAADWKKREVAQNAASKPMVELKQRRNDASVQRAHMRRWRRSKA